MFLLGVAIGLVIGLYIEYKFNVLETLKRVFGSGG